MDRRSFLVTGLAGLAGCSTIDSPERADAVPGGPTSTGTPDGEVTPAYPTPARDTDLVFEFEPDRTDASLEVGDADAVPGTDRSHALAVWNDGPGPRTLELRVRDRTDGSAPVDDDFEVSSGGSVAVSFLEPSDYVVDVRIPETGTGASVSVGAGRIDCNASSTFLRVGPDGQFSAASFSTLVGCPSHRTAS